MSEETMDFLKEVVATAPDLGPEGEEEGGGARSKRRRCVRMHIQYAV